MQTRGAAGALHEKQKAFLHERVPATGSMPPQVLEHDWVVTRGGAVMRPLGSGVVRGAANVAAIRRLRNLAHGIITVKRCRSSRHVTLTP